jgi:hypothetical protein
VWGRAVSVACEGEGEGEGWMTAGRGGKCMMRIGMGGSMSSYSSAETDYRCERYERGWLGWTFGMSMVNQSSDYWTKWMETRW